MYKKGNLATYIRNSSEYKNWCVAIATQYNHQCFISGKVSKDLEIHHSHTNFSILLKEIMKYYNVGYHTPIETIPKDLLNQIMRTFWARHKEAKGIPLDKPHHKALHKRYGVYATYDQLLQFKNEYNHKNI
jgi:hypothetical protein